MESDRRKEIRDVQTDLQEMLAHMENLKERITQIREDEDAYRDNMPENMMESEKFAKSEEASNALQEIEDLLQLSSDDFDSYFDTATE